MKFEFKARIYKAGINPYVKVPLRITGKLSATRGYIPIKGKIEKHFFQQTLVPVKSDGYRLYVNGPMLKATGLDVGDTAHFSIGQDTMARNQNHPMPKFFKKKLEEQGLLKMFQQLTPSRRKEINRYLNNLKTEEALVRNVAKMVKVLKGKESSPLYKIN